MTDLTSEELAIVASEVTGDEHRARGDVVLTINLEAWSPSFDKTTGQWRRDQALAVVEWLAEHCDGGEWGDAGEAIISKNTTALQRMVLELRNPK